MAQEEYMNWLEAKVVLENDKAISAADIISDIFSGFGLQGTVIEEPGGEPEEGWGDNAVPLPENYAVIGYFPENDLLNEKCAQLEHRLSILKEDIGIQYKLFYKKLNEEDWAESWKAFFHPERLTDNIVVKPTWRDYDAGPNDIILEIDPGMAFGSGIHPTTSACIEMIQTYISPNDRMLDVGVGSGILMIAGAKLGALKIVGVDLDEVAVGIAEKNLLINGIEPERFQIMTGDLIDPIVHPMDERFKTNKHFDIVTANILSEVIIKLLDDIPEVMAENGILIASGIIEKNKNPVVEKMVETGFDIIEVRIKEGWTTIAGEFQS